ncbi:MAG: AmmeMemoRadiSam system radical SAM enzyme [Desulfobacterota bacterium]|nr:AmmeMemoRadiSam system radical SAM enzyme [Thermodesulfobacteriota bacterium]
MGVSRREFLKKAGEGFLRQALLPGFLITLFKASRACGEKRAEILREALHYQKLPQGRVRCHLCFRGCEIFPGRRGFCRNRENWNGTLYSIAYGKAAALQIDPIEKEPSFHMIPGTQIFCTATASCNFRCKFCHNWHLSQKGVEEVPYVTVRPEEIVRKAIEYRCETVSFTYSEPTVFYEYMLDIVRIAKEKGLKTLYHTNGSIRKEPLLALLPYMDAVTVDLKAFTERFYSDISSSELEPVLQTLKTIRSYGRHLEIVNLLIPTLNDDPADIQRMCHWIRNHLGKEIPLHLNRFFPNYKLTHLPPTPIETLERAHRIAKEAGLEYVYIGNVPGHEKNSTFCPRCQKKIIHRTHFSVTAIEIRNGKCRFCGYPIAGIWA